MDSQIYGMDNLQQIVEDQEKRIRDLEQANAALISEVKKRFVSKNEFAQSMDQIAPRTGLTSPDFMKRAFSVWGHHFVAQLIINIVIGVIYFVIVVLILGKTLIPRLF
jgi:hypothetical protein